MEIITRHKIREGTRPIVGTERKGVTCLAIFSWINNGVEVSTEQAGYCGVQNWVERLKKTAPSVEVFGA